jgi:hypothetical protein
MTSSEQITVYLESLPGWKRDRLKLFRDLIHEADPEITEEWKWNTPVFSHNGMVCAFGSFSDHVKINFFQGAALPDPNSLFNAGLEAKKTRSIDFKETDSFDEEALKALLRIAVLHNTAKK